MKPPKWAALSRLNPVSRLSLSKLQRRLAVFLAVLMAGTVFLTLSNIDTARASAPTLIGTSGNNWTTVGATARTTGSLSWLTGDVIVVMGVTENNTTTLSTPTGSGLSFSLVTSTNTGSSCKGYVWSATAASGSSGTISSNVNNAGDIANIQAYVYRGSDGLGNSVATAAGSTPTISLTRASNNSAVVWLGGDFNATNDTTVTSVPSSGATQRQTAYSLNDATMFTIDWTDQGTAGSTSYGISGFTTPDVFTNVAIEIKGSSNVAPAAPTLSLPASGSLGVSITPQFQLRTTDADSDYLRYKIEVCSIADCSSVLRTIDQTSSQTGWSGQDQQTSTAYTGNASIGSSTMAVHTYQTPALSLATQYWWRAYAIDPGGSNSFGSASAIQAFTTDSTPAAPTLSVPASSATGVSIQPRFNLSTTDADGDYVQYKIEVCSVSNCSSVLRTIDQTSSQVGWGGQDQSAGTAYAAAASLGSSVMASHFYQTPTLSPSTQYWWRAYAIDPAGSNAFSSASSIQSFTTGTSAVNVLGGTKIQGGTKIAN